MSNTGRFYVNVGGRKFCIEPIDNSEGKGKAMWGDLNPATGKVEGNYGTKNRGSIHESDSIITETNGFKNIVTLGKGESPLGYIQSLVDNS